MSAASSSIYASTQVVVSHEARGSNDAPWIRACREKIARHKDERREGQTETIQ